MKGSDFKNIVLGLGITIALLAGLILLPGMALAANSFQAAGTTTPTVTGTAGLPATGPTTYIVQPTDTLSSIAIAHGVTVMSIMNANTSIKDPNLIYVGQKLTIPARNLQPGESVWSGYDFHKWPSVAQYLAGLPATGANGTVTPAAPNAAVTATPVAPGAVATATPAAPGLAGLPNTGRSIQYTVGPMDTLSSIALAHGVTVQSLLNANPKINNPNILYAGQTITIPPVNLKPGESIWNGYNFSAHSSPANAFSATATAAAPATTATPLVPLVTATPTTSP